MCPGTAFVLPVRNNKDGLIDEIEDVKPLAVGLQAQTGKSPVESWARAAGCLDAVAGKCCSCLKRSLFCIACFPAAGDEGQEGREVRGESARGGVAGPDLGLQHQCCGTVVPKLHAHSCF